MFLLAAMSYAGKILDDFDDGDFEGWERSPQNKDNDKISWEVVNGEVVFDPGGHPGKGTVALCVQDKIVHYDNAVITGEQIPNLNMSPVQPEDKLAITWGKLKSSP